MVSVTIVWFGGQMTPSEAAAPLQSGPDPLLELLLLLLELPLLELLLELPLLELPLELLLPDSVSATTTRESSVATATSAPAPTSAYMSFDINLSSTIAPAASDGMFQFEAAPFPAIGYMWVKVSHRWPNQNVTKFAFAHALRDITPSQSGYSMWAVEQGCECTIRSYVIEGRRVHGHS
jgi:hypothetical protein